MFKVKLKKLYEDASTPVRGSSVSAGWDLFAYIIGEPVVIPPHENRKIGTGISLGLPNDICAFIMSRSGLASKQNLRPANCVGLCDPDYTGEYIVALHNDSDTPRMVENGDRIAQVVFVKYEVPEFNSVESLDDTERGAGGFGSTGQ